MIPLNKHFDSYEEARRWLDALVETNRISSYEMRPTCDYNGFDVFITPICPVEKIEIETTTVFDSCRKYR